MTTVQPYELRDMFDAVTVTGMFGTSAIDPELAKIGYALSAERIQPYRGR